MRGEAELTRAMRHGPAWHPGSKAGRGVAKQWPSSACCGKPQKEVICGKSGAGTLVLRATAMQAVLHGHAFCSWVACRT